MDVAAADGDEDDGWAGWLDGDFYPWAPSVYYIGWMTDEGTHHQAGRFVIMTRTKPARDVCANVLGILYRDMDEDSLYNDES